ncbi:YolD-like family protein [Bacillus toyonensis]|uniref:YolD-like family protein n=1 Tax=Bacillus toyonensis TaxID=155322 RepID=UPI003D1DD49D
MWKIYGSNHRIREIIQEQNKIQKPILEQQQVEEIGRVLHQSLCLEEKIHISYYQNGYIHHEMVTAMRIDPHKKEVITTDAFRNRCVFAIDEIVDCLFIF